VVSTTNWLWVDPKSKTRVFFFFFLNFFCVSDTMVHPKFETLFIYLFLWMVLALVNRHVIDKCFKNFAPSKLGKLLKTCRQI